MKRTILTLSLTTFLSLGNAFGVAVSVLNSSAPFLPIGDASGAGVANDTFLWIGTTTTGSPGEAAFDAAVGGLPGSTPAQAAAVLADFTAFISTDFSGVPTASLFTTAGTANVGPGGSTLDGAAVYIIAGDAPDLASSTSLLVYKSGEVLPNDDSPTASLDINMGADFNGTGAVLFGSTGDVTVGAASVPGVLGGRLIPEPGTSLLAFLSIGFLAFRRRR